MLSTSIHESYIDLREYSMIPYEDQFQLHSRTIGYLSHKFHQYQLKMTRYYQEKNHTKVEHCQRRMQQLANVIRRFNAYYQVEFELINALQKPRLYAMMNQSFYYQMEQKEAQKLRNIYNEYIKLQSELYRDV